MARGSMLNRLMHLTGDNDANTLHGTHARELIRGFAGDDVIESGGGSDIVIAGRGDDKILSFSWGGEPDIAQDTDATKVEPGEPIEDDDLIVGGQGADIFEFRWLIDAKDEILDKHRDADGNVDYQAVAGENGNVHDHWVESMGDKTIADFNPEEDTLVFEGHTVNLASTVYEDVNGDGTIDTVFSFVSVQNGGGAHDGDLLGTLTILDNVVELDNNGINRGVFYGVEDPYAIDG